MYPDLTVNGVVFFAVPPKSFRSGSEQPVLSQYVVLFFRFVHDRSKQLKVNIFTLLLQQFS